MFQGIAYEPKVAVDQVAIGAYASDEATHDTWHHPDVLAARLGLPQHDQLDPVMTERYLAIDLGL